MNRRRFLAALPLAAVPTVATAGCLDAASSLPGGASDPHPRRASLSAVGSLPDGLRFSIDAEVTVPEVTDGHPAEVVLTATNEGEKRDVGVATGRCRPFNRGQGQSENGGLWLYAPDEEPNERKNGRWEFDPDGPVGYASYGCMKRTWEAGESHEFVYAVWDDFETAGYYEPGRYRWEYVVSAAQSDGEETDEATWGFELTVEDARE